MTFFLAAVDDKISRCQYENELKECDKANTNEEKNPGFKFLVLFHNDYHVYDKERIIDNCLNA